MPCNIMGMKSVLRVNIDYGVGRLKSHNFTTGAPECRISRAPVDMVEHRSTYVQIQYMYD